MSDRLDSPVEAAGQTSDLLRAASARVGDVVAGYTIDALVLCTPLHVLYHAHLGDRLFTLRALPERTPSAARAQLEAERVRAERSPAPGLPVIREIIADRDGVPLQVMERVAGRPLSLRFDPGTALDLDAALAIAEQVARCIADWHERGFPHGAVHADNILCDETPGAAPRVTLLGARRVPEAGSRRTVQVVPELDAWSAPETLAHGVPSVAGDVYGLGILIQFLLARKGAASPSVAGSARFGPGSAVLVELAAAGLASKSLLDRLGAVLSRCLAARAEDRFPSAAEVASSLSALGGERVSGRLPATISGPIAAPSTPPPLAPLGAAGIGPGATCGKWQLGRVVGEGEFGAVYEAEHTLVSGLRAALKILHPHKALEEGTIRRFLDEASAASRANHENIVQVFDAGAEPGGVCYLAMELLRGESLASRIRAGKLDADQTIHIGLQIAEALDAAHRLGIVHRDLKPDNVFLTERSDQSDFVKLFDFGIARLRDQKQSGDKPRTRSGVVMGTPEYMSPEQWHAAPDIDGRTDLYALGILLYECLVGRPPFVGNLYTVMQMHVEDPLPALPDVGPRRGALDGLLRMLTAKEREQRPVNARAVVSLLHAVSAGVSGVSGADAPTPLPGVGRGKPARPRSATPARGGVPQGTASPVALPAAAPTSARRWPLVVAAAVAFTGSVAAGGWLFSGKKPPAARDPVVTAVAARAIVEPDPPTAPTSSAPAPSGPPATGRVATAVTPASPPQDGDSAHASAAPAASRPVTPTTAPVENAPSVPVPARPTSRADASRAPAHRARCKPVVSGADAQAGAIIVGCVTGANLRPPYRVVLEGGRNIHITDGPANAAFRECLREGFAHVVPPARAEIRCRE